ncbi:M15 family metallopeptidase [Microbacterium sp.]|uniref:M15 family metallopeptidase n=1 Tax=Microbacterium sp. TaxID=51671 RepID=UPI0039E3FBA4
MVGAAFLAVVIVTAIALIAQQASAPASAVVGAETDAGTGSTADGGSPVDDGVIDEDDGRIDESDRVSVFSGTPAVANLDAELLAALRAAATAAERDGVRLQVNSGWRSAAYQEQLLADAVEKYGSAEEAARWVATPEHSEHVSGDAVDLGPVAGQDWLSRHGAEFGLCQIYANEPWHFELRAMAPANGCPEMYEDPTADPRTQP